MVARCEETSVVGRNVEPMATKLQRIAEKAHKDPSFKFTNLFYLMNDELLRGCFRRLRKDAAAGIDGVTKEEYAENLDTNLDTGSSVRARLHRRRLWVPPKPKLPSSATDSERDLVLMDIQMPIMNSEEALQRIRSKEQGTSLHKPVIALTAYALRGESERFLQEGFDGYVSKPLSITELVNEMKRVTGALHQV